MTAPVGSETFVCRGEFCLARPAFEPLREAPLTPVDPLSVHAQALQQVRYARGERAVIKVGIMPANPGRRQRLTKRLVRQGGGGKSNGSAGGGFAESFMQELGFSPANGNGRRGAQQKREPVDVVEQRRDLQQTAGKLLVPQGMFELQVLVRTEAPSRERADALFRAIHQAWHIYAGENHLRVSGIELGVAFLGSDWRLRRRWFDYRMDTGWFRPASVRGGNVVNVSEIAPWLKPFTARCPVTTAVRGGPWMPPAPHDLPTYRKQRGVLPLGMVSRANGSQQMVGMRASEYLFGTLCGRSGMGKTTTALGQFLHVALVESRAGAMFFDPHAPNALDRLLPFLAAPGVRERVILMNLAEPDGPHVAWNLFSMQGLTDRHIIDRGPAISDSISIAAGGSFQQRSSALLENGVTALLHLALLAPKELAPTIFTLPRFLTDDQFREAAVARLPEHLRGFWRNEFEAMPAGSTIPVCQLISRMQNNPVVRATFGSPVSTFDPRAAMDAGALILAAPPSVDDQVVCSLMMRGFIAGMRSRGNVEESRRRLSYWFMDEAQVWDAIVRGTTALAVIFEQLRKYGARVMPMTQNPGQFAKPTWAAIRTNASFIGTYGTEPDAAKEFNSLWAGVDATRAVAKLPAHEMIGQVTHNGLRGDPFRMHGVLEGALFPEHYHPELLPELDAAIDARCRPRTVAETLKAIEGHDDRIFQFLQGGGQGGPSGGGGGSPAPRPSSPSSPRADSGGVVVPLRPSRDPRGWDNEA